MVDELVRAHVIRLLSRPDIADVFGPDEQAATEASERAEGIRARHDGAADQYATG